MHNSVASLDIEYVMENFSKPIIPECRLYVQSVIVAIADASKPLPNPNRKYGTVTNYLKLPTVWPKLTAFDYLYSEPFGVAESGVNLEYIRRELIHRGILYPVPKLVIEVKHNQLIYSQWSK